MAGTAAVELHVRDVDLKFRVGERTLYSVAMQLPCHTFSLTEVLSGAYNDIFPAASHLHSMRIGSLPVSGLAKVRRACPGLLLYEEQRYPRHYIRLEGTFDDYMRRLSGKTRSTLRRKVRKWRDMAGGKVDVHEYRSGKEMRTFHECARRVSRTTYQELILGAGLPDDSRYVEDMVSRATQGLIRSYILFYGDRPVSYLYLPVDADCLIYAYLGYDPGFSAYSPGTVLQVEVLKRLFEEQAFRLLDFTEGDGQHKRVFGTDYVECCNLFVLPPTLRYRVLLTALRSFEGTVKTTSAVAERAGLKTGLRRMLRRAT